MEKHTKRKIAAVTLGGFLLMSTVCGCGSQDAAEQQETVSRIPVDVETVEVQDFDKLITLGGLTAAENTVQVIAKVGGMEQIKAVHVKVGDKVSAGQVLAQLDNETSAINLSNAQLAYDNAYTNYENANNTLRQAQMAMDYATVTAPISGTVTMVNANVGSFATASAPMFEIANVDTLEISTGINEQNVSKIKIGQEVLLKIHSVSDKWMSGTITEISKVMNAQTKNYPVTIALANKDDDLVAGMYAEVQVAVEHAEDVLVIPVDAIVYKEAKPVAFIAQADGTVKEKALTLGINDGDNYVVTKGLQAGDQIVVKGNGNLVEGEPISIITLDGVEQDLNLNAEADAEPEQSADGETASAEKTE